MLSDECDYSQFQLDLQNYAIANDISYNDAERAFLKLTNENPSPDRVSPNSKHYEMKYFQSLGC